MLLVNQVRKPDGHLFLRLSIQPDLLVFHDLFSLSVVLHVTCNRKKKQISAICRCTIVVNYF